MGYSNKHQSITHTFIVIFYRKTKIKNDLVINCINHKTKAKSDIRYTLNRLDDKTSKSTHSTVQKSKNQSRGSYHGFSIEFYNQRI